VAEFIVVFVSHKAQYSLDFFAMIGILPMKLQNARQIIGRQP